MKTNSFFRPHGLLRSGSVLLLGAAALAVTGAADAAISCQRTLVANVVAIDQPLMFNRLGAQNINGMVFALEDDVVNTDTNRPLSLGGAAVPGKVQLRADKRPRPLVLRIAAGECLTVVLRNLLTEQANPRKDEVIPELKIDDQVADRTVGFNIQGMQAVGSIADLSANTGANANALVAPGGSRTYTVYAEHEGAFAVHSYGATFGADGTAGNVANGLFGQVIVLPKGGRAYRNAVAEEEMRLATTGRTPAGQPVINYEARFPNAEPWVAEGKAGKPILAMVDAAAGNRIVHSDGDAVVLGPNADGSFPASTYPLESIGKRNPAYPNRLEPFRDFASLWHDEAAVAQAFPGFFNDPVFGHVLQATRDAFMINYGSGGIGSEIIANRLGVGPMHDCLSCAYEEFFLTAYVVGDPAQLVDVPANVGLEALRPGEAPPPGTTGIKAAKALFPADPANVHHSYIGDFVKMRNTHVGHEQHVFHLHNHQWLFNPNDDNSNYIDAQGIGPGSSYTYEMVNGGSGNRNRSAGDAIYHCHFYPHFAQGMWYMWRIHDTFEEGTRLAVSGSDFHAEPFALRDGTPAQGARALPDGELVVGAPIPAIVPLPGKAMPPMPGKVEVVAKVSGPDAEVVGSVALVDRSPGNYNPDGTLKNPGFPFWVAGIESIMGQRPPTPPLDMLNAAQAQALKDSGNPLWDSIDPGQAGGWDGGLPRHALQGAKAGGAAEVTITPLDFMKRLIAAEPVYFPEEGTDVEQAAMAFHAKSAHQSFAVLPNGSTVARNFLTNGAKPMAGAPYAEPCVDDRQRQLTSALGKGSYVSGETPGSMSFSGSSPFNAQNPRVYKGANIQFDAVFNKVGYHFPQQRIIALWEDVMPVINKEVPPEPLVMRLNTFDCAMYHHTNLVPEFYELDDYQVRTPTDIIGQHIHLPKWDLSTTDGAANGWNYEDGTLSPGAVYERIHAIRHFNHCVEGDARDGSNACPLAKEHPYFGQFGRPDWKGARTTLQRWFADPVVNVNNVDRGLGNIFTHDHYGPSTHQQVGLYATVLTQPAGSTWYHSETGEPMYTRDDGGPVSWQAVIAAGDIDGDGKNDSYREFYLEFTDFQHAYEAGVYVGAGPDGRPDPVAYPATADSFRYAINPPGKKSMNPVMPDLQITVAGGQKAGCPTRPCPQAISADDPGMFVVNYRNEPIALRVYDPNRMGPDGKPGMQAEGLAGDLAYALQTRTDRKIASLNQAPSAITSATGPTGGVTTFPPHINAAGDLAGDPFTPLLRTYSGDRVRIRVQAGGQEEEHNIGVHGVKWLQSGSSFGSAPNSGWRNAQMAGISEQFGFAAPIFMGTGSASETADYLYSVDTSTEGYWNGAWGVMRNYTKKRDDLFAVPNNPRPISIKNGVAFNGVCPRLTGGRPTATRKYDVVAVLANDILANPLNLTIGQQGSDGMHVGAPLKADGGTLVYNPRAVTVPVADIVDEEGEIQTIGGHAGPLHDPTAIMYVRKADLDPATGKLKAGVPIEPLVLRAAAGDCIEVTVENRLPQAMPDLPTNAIMQPIVIRDRAHAQGTTSFNNNLMRPSSHVGLHAQLLAYDVTSSDGTNVGINPVQTVAPRAPGATAWPVKTYKYYAGDLRLAELATPKDAYNNVDAVFAEPVEFGGFNLMPADMIKQTQKGMVGAMVVEPARATWSEDVAMRAAATVSAPGQAPFRSFALAWQKGLNFRWANGDPVENIATEGFGVPADPKDGSDMAINYRTEPLWYRFGKAPDAPFGHGDGHGHADVEQAHMAYSNELAGGDPVTPVLKVNRGQPFRMHVTMPAGGSRGGTFGLHGHIWARDPYLAQNVDAQGYPQKFAGVGSVRIGNNPLSMFLGGQESILPGSHFSFVFPSAGGANAVAGDYLFRDLAAFGNLSGRWGILRVE